MLKKLYISNYALIENLELEFGPGLTIITGETGAGKSIMLGALSLVMGGRADSRVVADSSRKSVVEALFVDVDPALKPVLEQKQIDWLSDSNGVSELSIRREVTSSGRSKVFVNDSPVTLQALSEITPRLIDIHSQHANAKINDPAERLRIIDALAGNEESLRDYRTLFDEYVELRHRIRIRRESIARAERDSGFIRFQLEQLDRLKPKRGELAEIERRFEVLSDADEFKEKLSALAAMLGTGDRGAETLLGEASALAGKIDFSLIGNDSPVTNAEEGGIPARLRGLIIEVKDICAMVEDYNSRIDTDPAALGHLSERMNLYYETVKRFHVKDADELVGLHESLRERLALAETGDDDIAALEREARHAARELKVAADRLSESRLKAAAEFSGHLCDVARPLGLPNINFVAEARQRKLSSSGQDEIEFLCSFNKNGVPAPVGSIASGGEIARMMLSLKSIMAGHINLPTIIFDEVDTGVSGEIADKMGAMMHDVSRMMQVIVITHLPQVASKGDAHFKVYKTDGETRTVTNVEPLTMEGRIRELASMISGSEVSEAALSAARALLKVVK